MARSSKFRDMTVWLNLMNKCQGRNRIITQSKIYVT